MGLLFGGAVWPLLALCMIWGVAVVADSAQFSSSVMELADPAHTGTMVTVQISVGFLLTLFALHLLPPLVDLVGWRYAFVFLVPGPVFGFIAMARLRAHPDSAKLAGGRR